LNDSRAKALLGKWRVTEMDLWDSDYIDMMGPGHILIGEAGGEMAFGCVRIGLHCEYGQESIFFSFEGSDELEEVSGDGDAELEEDGTLTDEVRFDNGDEATFRASRWVDIRELT
jgi:hypothetical protein